MRKPHVDDFVRLTQDIPELSLNRGSLGVVRSTWFAPTVAYEVEFDAEGAHDRGAEAQGPHSATTRGLTRGLLLPEQVRVEDARMTAP